MSDAWDTDVLGRVAEALRRADSGTPTILQIDGVAGMGKSTLLNELAKQAVAADFEVLETEAMQGDSTPYGSLTGWGFQAERTLSGDFPPSFRGGATGPHPSRHLR